LHVYLFGAFAHLAVGASSATLLVFAAVILLKVVVVGPLLHLVHEHHASVVNLFTFFILVVIVAVDLAINGRFGSSKASSWHLRSLVRETIRKFILKLISFEVHLDLFEFFTA